MTTDPTKTSAEPTSAVEMARALFEALKRRDVDAVLALDADDAVGDVVAVGEFQGKPAIRDRVFGTTSRAAVQWHATGTFSGARFQGIEPTGKRVEIRGLDVVDVADDVVVRDTMFYDGATLARQLGMLPRRGSGTDKALRATFNRLTRLRWRCRRPSRSVGESATHT